ncbi:MAG: RNA methyltransferase [Puniceicoccaceae bacterium]|nr:MAG: RNA methyltransferase [Puniceicoccaceae bacterium]
MRSTKFNISVKSTSGWEAAVLLTEAYISGNQKSDQLLDGLPEEFTGHQRAACQSLFLGALRHGHRTLAALKKLIRKKAKPGIKAILLVTGYELLDASPERHPKIIHHAVERSKRRVNRFEQGFLNAVLRKLPSQLIGIQLDQDPAAYYSHPKWLLEHWTKEFPSDWGRLLDWNQNIPASYLKLYLNGFEPPNGIERTEWPQFYKITGEASWQEAVYPLLNKGIAYIKDPSTRLAPELLAPKAGESVLDLCAAPGGKAFDLAHAMQCCGQIVAVDLPGPRIGRLQENLATLASPEFSSAVIEADLLTLTSADLASQGLPQTYDAVMLDAPCSNTGVIQRRTDVKWRLQPGDIAACAKLQLDLLAAASPFVKPGGRLVYSTCSIEQAENQQVVDVFLCSDQGHDFKLSKSITSLPWETGHDGAGAFRLDRTSEK